MYTKLAFFVCVCHLRAAKMLTEYKMFEKFTILGFKKSGIFISESALEEFYKYQSRHIYLERQFTKMKMK